MILPKRCIARSAGAVIAKKVSAEGRRFGKYSETAFESLRTRFSHFIKYLICPNMYPEREFR